MGNRSRGAVFAPEFCQPKKSSHEAARASGRSRFVYETLLMNSPPAINKGERNAGRRIVLMPAHKRRAGRATEKSGLRRPPLAGALACRHSTYGFRQEDFRPEGSASGQASRRRRQSAACRPRHPQSQRCTSRASLSAGRHNARAAREQIVSFRPRAPHSLRRQGVPSRMASFKERGSGVYCRRFRQVKGVGISFDKSAHLAQYGFQRVRRTPMIRMAFRHGRARPGHPRFWCGKF